MVQQRLAREVNEQELFHGEPCAKDAAARPQEPPILAAPDRLAQSPAPVPPSAKDAHSPTLDLPGPAEAVEERVYGAPRVFDLYTMLAVTLAFALLVSGMQLMKPMFLEATTAATVSVALFVTGIGICQAFFFSGKHPRSASLVAGPLMLVSLTAGSAMLYGLPLAEAVASSFCSAVFGVAAGYLGGAVVAGVFLIADALRNPSFFRSTSKRPKEEDVDFDHIE